MNWCMTRSEAEDKRKLGAGQEGVTGLGFQSCAQLNRGGWTRFGSRGRPYMIWKLFLPGFLRWNNIDGSTCVNSDIWILEGRGARSSILRMLMLQVNIFLCFLWNLVYVTVQPILHIGSFYPIPWFPFVRSRCTQEMAVLIALSGRVFWCLFGAL